MLIFNLKFKIKMKFIFFYNSTFYNVKMIQKAILTLFFSFLFFFCLFVCVYVNVYVKNFWLLSIVSRIQGRGENYEMDLTLDVNTEIYPIEIGDKYALMLASSLSIDGTEKTEIWRDQLKNSLADDYEYVMYGKVFKYDDSNGSKV